MRTSTITRTILALLVAVAIAAVSMPAASQNGPTNDEIERIREERRAAQAEAAEKAKEVDAGSDELEQVTAALVAMQASVNAQEGRAADAQRQLVDAEIRVAESEQAVAEQRAEIVELRELLAQRAIVSFINQNDTGNVFAESEDASQAIRMQTLVDQVTQADVDVAELFRAAEEDLQLEESHANRARQQADALRLRAEDELALLEEEEEARAVLTAEAEDRLDQLLSEQAALQALDASLGRDEQAAVNALAEELARKAAAAPPPSGGGGGGGGTVTAAEISNAGNGIWVHNSIVGNIQRLLADAAAAGVPLAGGGYRDPAAQIRVRRNNCGTSNYAIYEMPASRCRPPTARPGRSMHEQGRAIDFTYNGRIIGSRSGPAWNWLKNNAANYGLYNLPSEPWHWSTNGN